jgi:hypothetical protein
MEEVNWKIPKKKIKKKKPELTVCFRNPRSKLKLCENQKNKFSLNFSIKISGGNISAFYY